MKRIDWSAVDWSQPTKALAKQLGVWPTVVSQNRKKHAPHTHRSVTGHPNRMPDGIDWSMSTVAIARKFGLPVARVFSARLYYAPETLGRGKSLADGRLIDWSAIDWTRPNREIAEQHQLDMDLVQRKRKKHAPDVIDETKIRWDNIDWSLSNKELSKRLNVGPDSICMRRRQYAPKTVGRGRCLANGIIPNWEKIDWSESTSVIAKRLGVPTNTVAKARTRFAAATKLKMPDNKIISHNPK